jgi:hypothetical protein
MTKLTNRQIAKRLTDHQTAKMAGFYPSTGGRAFLARVRKGVLEISYDFETFEPVKEGTTFDDHNGRAIF